MSKRPEQAGSRVRPSEPRAGSQAGLNGPSGSLPVCSGGAPAAVAYEYRVTWRREGQAKKRAHYQTEAGAKACAERQRSAAKEMDWLSSPLPPVVEGPFIECRLVGPWTGRVLLADFNTEVPVDATA